MVFLSFDTRRPFSTSNAMSLVILALLMPQLILECPWCPNFQQMSHVIVFCGFGFFDYLTALERFRVEVLTSPGAWVLVLDSISCVKWQSSSACPRDLCPHVTSVLVRIQAVNISLRFLIEYSQILSLVLWLRERSCMNFLSVCLQ